MPNHRLQSSIVAAAICVGLAGCTTLEVYDRYSLVEGASEYDLTRTAQPYGVWIDTDTRLYSIGMLGVPLVPTKVRSGAQTGFGVSVWLNTNTVREFSFASAPCLQGGDGRTFCPYEVEIANFTLPVNPPSETDAERRFREMLPKKRIKNLVIPLDGAMQAQPRIDRERIYRHFMLDDATLWQRFSVDLTYRYRCGDACPPRLSVERTGLIEIDGRSALEGRVVFERKRVRDYQPAAQVQ